MEKGEHKLEIFRGLIKFKSNVQKIWGVLFVLSVITTVEVVLGILKPQPLSEDAFWYENSKLDFYNTYNTEGILYYMGLHAC